MEHYLDTIILAVIAIFAGISGLAAWFTFKNTKKHYTTHEKYISSQIIMQILKMTENYYEINNKILEKDIKEYETDDDLEPYMNHLEGLGRYYRDGLVTYEHVENDFVELLIKIKKDNLLEHCFGDKIKLNTRRFENVKYLIAKITPPNDSKKE